MGHILGILLLVTVWAGFGRAVYLAWKRQV